ncbi:MAG: tetratricopeptide repeat protein [Treponema sp.]|nr:tetratricopeptide repeat protein [Treponema sp.]
MKKTGLFILAGMIALNLTGCLTTESIFDFDDDELNAYYENEIRKGTEEKLAAKEAEKSKTTTTAATTAKKAETTDQKVERAKQLSKSDKLEDLETASKLVEEARAAEPWNMDLFDLDDEITEKLYVAKVKEADRLYKSGSASDLDKAGKLVEEVLDKRPGNTDARNLKSKIAVAKSRIKADEVSLEQNLQDARDYIRSNSPELAIKKLEKVLSSYPNNAEAKTLMADARTLQARTLAMDKGYLDEAEKILNTALKDLPTHSDAKALLAEVKELKKAAENCPFKVGSVYKLTAYKESGKNVKATQWKPDHRFTFTSKSTMEENANAPSSFAEYGFHVDTASRKILFNNTAPRHVLYTNVTYSSDLKTITLMEIDIDGKLNGRAMVFTLAE